MHVEERPSPWKQVIDPLSQLLRKIGVLEEEDPGKIRIMNLLGWSTWNRVLLREDEVQLFV